jgi:hypothetical protein
MTAVLTVLAAVLITAAAGNCALIQHWRALIHYDHYYLFAFAT